ANAIPDAWAEMLAAQGFAYGQRNDSWYAFLGGLGYEGNMNDREMLFWGAGSGGVISPDGVRITQQPVDWRGLEGATATFTVVATSGNASPLSYQWQELNGSWANTTDAGTLSGSITDTLTITPVVIADQGRRFRVLVTNTFNTITSQAASLIITGATYFITDEDGNRTITENTLDPIVDERSQ
ncbi:unnamed protein product, partial [marine sediment metagenome]